MAYLGTPTPLATYRRFQVVVVLPRLPHRRSQTESRNTGIFRRMASRHPMLENPDRNRRRDKGYQLWRPWGSSRLSVPVIQICRILVERRIRLVESLDRSIRVARSEGICLGVIHTYYALRVNLRR